jgi:hypothetical protein
MESAAFLAGRWFCGSILGVRPGGRIVGRVGRGFGGSVSQHIRALAPAIRTWIRHQNGRRGRLRPCVGDASVWSSVPCELPCRGRRTVAVFRPASRVGGGRRRAAGAICECRLDIREDAHGGERRNGHRRSLEGIPGGADRRAAKPARRNVSAAGQIQRRTNLVSVAGRRRVGRFDIGRRFRADGRD